MTVLAPAFSIDALYLVAKSILAASVRALTDNGVVVPTNQFVSWNAPSSDCCDILAVHFDTGSPSRGNGSAMAATVCATSLKAQYIITIYECVPVSNIGGNSFPPPADLDLSAQMLLRQSWTIYQSILCESFGNTLMALLTPQIPCQIVKIGNLVPHGPQGGCAHATISLEVELA